MKNAESLEGTRSTGDQSVYQEGDRAYLIATLDKDIGGKKYLNQILAIFEPSSKEAKTIKQLRRSSRHTQRPYQAWDIPKRRKALRFYDERALRAQPEKHRQSECGQECRRRQLRFSNGRGWRDCVVVKRCRLPLNECSELAGHSFEYHAAAVSAAGCQIRPVFRHTVYYSCWLILRGLHKEAEGDGDNGLYVSSHV